MGFTTILAIASVGMQALGASKAAKAQKSVAQANAAQAAENARIAKENAADVVERGEIAYRDRGLRTRQIIGSARAYSAGAGISLEGGTTAAALQDDIRYAGAADILTMKMNTGFEEKRALNQGAQFTAQSNLYAKQAAGISPFMSGLTAGVGALNQNADILFPSTGG